MVRSSCRALLIACALATPWLGPIGEAHAGDTVTNPAPGIKLIARTTTGPNERIFASFISLCHDGIRINARGTPTSLTTSQAWGTATSAKLAVNGDFYRTDRSPPTVYGDAVGSGVRWPSSQTGLGTAYAGDWYHGHYGWIAFGDGWVEFDHTGYVKDHATALGVTQGYLGGTRTTTIPAGTRALVSGFPELVVEGTVATAFPDRGDCADLNPRTAMGLSEDRHTFMLVTVDGRATSSVGMTCAQLAVLMKSLGAYTAFNLDGGGSTQMFVAGRGTVNQPSDGFARQVATHWGVFTDGTPANASCFQSGGCFPSPVPTAIGARFGDLPDDAPGAAAAAVAVDRGLIAGCQAEPAMFCPGCGLKRRDALALVVRAEGLDLAHPPGSATFADVPSTDPMYAEIEAASAAGLTTGCGGGKLCPDAVVTRGEVAAMIARARRWSASPDAATFADVPADHPYRGEIEAVAGHCAATGCASGGFCPDDPAARGEAVALVGAAFGLIADGACVDAGGGGDAGTGGGGSGGGGGCATSSGTSAGGVLLLALALALVRFGGPAPRGARTARARRRPATPA